MFVETKTEKSLEKVEAPPEHIETIEPPKETEEIQENPAWKKLPFNNQPSIFLFFFFFFFCGDFYEIN